MSIHCQFCGSIVCGLDQKGCRKKELKRGIKEAEEGWFQDELIVRKFAQLWLNLKSGNIDRFTAQSWYNRFGIDLWTKGELAVKIAS